MYFRVGQSWDNDHASIDKATRTGFNRVKLSYYAKGMFNLRPRIQLDKLLSFEQTMNMNEKALRLSSRVGYEYFTHMLCIDIWTELDEIVIDLNQKVQMISCYKNIIGYLFDFGQYAITESDTINTQKPYGPFAKLLDKCSLGNSQSWASKTYKPFSKGTKPSLASALTVVTQQYWVGDGSWNSGGCFPGNVLVWLIDLDRWKASNWPTITPQAGYIPKDFKGIGTTGSENLNNYLINYIQPWVDVIASKFVDSLRDANEKPENLGDDNELEYAQFGAPFETVEETIA